MAKEIDARGLACPQPVILAKKAIEDCDTVVVIVDNSAAIENVTRMAESGGYDVNIERKQEDTHIHIKRKSKGISESNEKSIQGSNSGSVVIVISEDRMGRGDEQLGYILIRSFIHTLIEASSRPNVLIFFNSGVKLTIKDSEVIEDLQILESNGVDILVCGTCLNYFKLTDEIAAGQVSNMYDITEAMLGAGRLVTV
ncbi:MAG: sulfurtransferase-like selenium metabolism protein YedF [Spirochaetota bacterium]|nr:sulfurtransferase-like selenium metabolism protein YedF [Spirochaetota bacterium]